MAKRKFHHSRADKIAVRELELFAENDSKSYFGCYLPLVKAATKHNQKGRFNAGKLCNAIRKRCVPIEIKRYNDDIGPLHMDTATRNVYGAARCKTAIIAVKNKEYE